MRVRKVAYDSSMILVYVNSAVSDNIRLMRNVGKRSKMYGDGLQIASTVHCGCLFYYMYIVLFCAEVHFAGIKLQRFCKVNLRVCERNNIFHNLYLLVNGGVCSTFFTNCSELSRLALAHTVTEICTTSSILSY